MDYRLLFLGLIFLLAAIILPTQAQTYPIIEISTLRYEPSPAQPGSYLHLYINVMNSGTEKADNLVVVLEPKFPFYLDEGENETRKIGSLEPLENAILDYKIRVAQDAVEGENTLKIKYSTDGGFTWIEKKIKINIQTLDANLIISNFESKEVEPGKIADLKITLRNEADSYLKNIKVRLAIDNLSLSPIETTEERSIYQMKSKEEKKLEFKLLVPPDANLGVYKVPITMSYYDNLGNKYSKTNYITLLVSSTPEIDVTIEKSTLLTYHQSGEVTLNVINKGLSQVKFLTIALGNSTYYTILSSPEIYIGDLTSDDYDTANFKIYVNAQVNQLPLKILLKYRDNNNQEYSQEKVINLRLYTPQELRKFNLVSTNYNSYIVAIIIVIIVFFYFWRKHRKKKR